MPKPLEQAGDWVSKFLAVRNQLAKIGSDLINSSFPEVFNPSLVQDFAVSISSAITGQGGIGKVLFDTQSRIWKDEFFYSPLQRYLKSLAGMADSDISQATALLAVKAVLESYRTYKIGASGVTSVGVHGGTGVHAAEKGPTAGVSADKSTAVDGTIAQDVAPIIVVWIELVDAMIRYSVPTETLSPAEAIELWQRGWMTEDRARDLVRLRGGVWDEIAKTANLTGDMATADEVIEYGRRANEGDAWIDDQLKRVGVVHKEDRDIRTLLYNEIPPVTDLLRFAQRNVTVDQVVKRFGLDDEFDRFWRDQLKSGLTAQGVSEAWARLYWRSHWITASVGQGSEALQRLRPGRVPQDIEFTKDDFTNLFRENDILPFWRDRFVKLAYQPITIRYIKSVYEMGLIDDAELQERLQDIGYSEEDAKLLVPMYRVQKARDLATQGHGFTAAELSNLLFDYAITYQQYDNGMAKLGYTEAQIDTFRQTVRGRQAAAANRRTISAIHTAYTGGAWLWQRAQDALAQLGLSQLEIDQLTQGWDLERQTHTHKASASELVQWYKDGLVPLVEFELRLTQLGYTASDILRVVAVANLAVSKAHAAEQTKALKAIQQARAKAAALAAARAKLAQHEAEVAHKLKVKEATQLEKEQWELKRAKINQEIEDRIAAMGKTAAKDKLKAQEKADERVSRAEETYGLDIKNENA